MKLGEAWEGLATLASRGLPLLTAAQTDTEVRSIAYDSRQTAPGALFVGLKGQHQDGTAFAADAVRRGAVCVVSEGSRPPDVAAPWLVVTDARDALARLSCAYYRNPSHELPVVGITGTNGKTTVAYLVSGVLEAAGLRPGRLGTVGYLVGSEERAAAHTTPEAPQIQALLREMVDLGCRACAMEVSSHALALKRVDGIRFAAAVFTNLTRDHLDFHGDMTAYFAAKRRLFAMLPEGAPAIVNIDDPHGAALARELSRVLTYATGQPADVTARELSMSLEGSTFVVDAPGRTLRLSTPLPGWPHVANVLAAVGVGCALEVPDWAIQRGIESVREVPGRFQIVSGPQDDIGVIVDYAHTDDALKTLLETARPLTRGRVISVFGCGGDRDRTKRPLMGAVAARLSDLVVLTSDNPRSEDPLAIIEEIKSGFVRAAAPVVRHGQVISPEATTPWVAFADRRAAIERALAAADPGDLVLIAGKGHERTQVTGSRVLPFDDVEVARQLLAARRVRGGAA